MAVKKEAKVTNIKSNQRVLSVFTLSMINVAAILSLRTLPQMATYGTGAIFFYVLTGIVFFIPTALVSAELATGWPQTGGVYIWVREAMGERWGFLAIWLQWIENLIWFPTILSFAAATIAFPFFPRYAQNKYYVLAMVLIIFWGSTLINFRGMKASGMISSVGVILGSLIPAAAIIGLGVLWLAIGEKSQISFSAGNYMPDMTNINNIVFAGGVLLGLAGMEMSAVHAQEVNNPKKDYPKAIFLSAIIILAAFILGSLAISLVIPGSQINLTTGIIAAFTKILDTFGLSFLVPLMALLLAGGAISQVSTWIVGPSKGLFATAKDGDLPPLFQKMNKNRMPTNMLISQAATTSVLSLIFLLMPSVNSSYFILTALTEQLYLIMYILMFASALWLRYSKPEVKRAYRVPGGNAGLWAVSGGGIVASLAVIVIEFFPPSQLQTGSVLFYESFLILGIVVMCVAPLLIHQFRKESWMPASKKKKKIVA